MNRPVLIACLAGGIALAALAGWRLSRPQDPARQANALLARGNVRGAELVLRSAVLNHPDNARDHYLLAAVELRGGDPAGAEREAHEAGTRGYDPAAVAVVLAQATVAQQRYAEALGAYRPTPAMTPAQTASIEVQRGLAQLGLGHPDDAAVAIAQAQRTDPHSYEAAMAAAQLARARHDNAAAAHAVDQALAVDPTAPGALLLRADLWNLAGDRARALTGYDAAVAHANGSVLPLLSRADLLSVMGDLTRARADLDAVLKAQPQNPVANFLLARLLIQTHRWADADAAMTKAGPIIDQVPRGTYLLAIVKINIGQPQQALDAAATYLTKAPETERIEAARLLGELCLRTRDPARAIGVLQPLATAGRADTAMMRVLAVAYQQAGDTPAAVRTLEQAKQSAPHDSALLTQLAAVRIGAGDMHDATADLQQALDVTAASPAVAPGLAASTGAPSPADAAVNLVLAAIQDGDADAATAALARLRTFKDVDPARLALLGGMVRLAHFDLAGAEAELTAAMQAHPGNVATQAELARVVALRGDKPRAEQMLGKLADADPANPVVLTSLVPLLTQDGHTDQAIMRLAAAHHAAPGSGQVTLALAQLEARSGQPQQALALVGTLGGALPPAQLLQLQAGFQAQSGQLPKAADSLRRAVALLPNNPVVAQSLVQMLLAAGDVDGAHQAATDALAASPGNAALLDSLVGIANRKGGTAAGLAMADQLARDPANGAAALPLKGDLLMSQRRFPEAATAYAAAAAAAPSSALVVRAALAEQSSGTPDAAAARLRTWLGQHPDDAGVAALLASLDLNGKRTAQARNELQVVLAQRPDDAASLNNLAVIEQQAGNLPRARDLAQRAYLLQPSGQTADTLGWIILNQDDPANALPLLSQASTSMKSDPGVQYHYAAALQKNGRAAEAAAILRPLVTRTAGFDEQTDAKRLLATLPHA